MALDLKRSFQKNLASVSLIEGMKETLVKLDEQGFVLGVLTSNGKENVESFLKLKMIDFMNFIVLIAINFMIVLKCQTITSVGLLSTGSEPGSYAAGQRSFGLKSSNIPSGFSLQIHACSVQPLTSGS